MNKVKEVLTPKKIASRVYLKHPTDQFGIQVKARKVKSLVKDIKDYSEHRLLLNQLNPILMDRNELKSLLLAVKDEIMGFYGAYKIRESDILRKLNETIEKL